MTGRAAAVAPAEAVGFLDWSKHRVNASPRPCRACAMPAFMTDAKGVPCHKVCAERDIAQRAEFHAGRGAQ